MPASMMESFPALTTALQTARLPLTAALAASELTRRSVALGFDLFCRTADTGFSLAGRMAKMPWVAGGKEMERIFSLLEDLTDQWTDLARRQTMEAIGSYQQSRAGEIAFLNLFADPLPCQELTCAPQPHQKLLDLPSLRLWDLSEAAEHAIDNYTVVFAPRAGHHSNIAERAALFMRDQGLTRMALVEQKCADEIPLHVGGKRHRENFAGQVEQYRQVLAFLKEKTGQPCHLVAVCQPGPLLMATLILNPELGRTFGSAGAPMHTEAQSGFLTDFSRAMGPNFIDMLMLLFGRTVPGDRVGSGRQIFDGRLQILGFYMLGMDQHLRNFRRLLADLKSGNLEAAERQQAFYRWYNYAHHFPVGFIRDTFQKIFVKNELMRGTLTIGERTLGVRDYPAGVPIWALGGRKDDIAPPLQATGHMTLIDSVSEKDKLTLVCEGGHMALFRSQRILEQYYSKIAEFMLSRSDRSEGK